MDIIIPFMTVTMVVDITRVKNRHILMLVTSADKMTNGNATGIWLEEFAVPYFMFTEAGAKVTVASTQGGKAPVDSRSTDDGAGAGKFDAAKALAQLENTVPVNKVKAEDFDAIFLPGGHGTMFDLPGNEYLGKILTDFASADKVIAAVCHGPAGFVGARRADGTPLVAGKTITSFTDSEEDAAGLTDAMPFLLETRLKEEGADFVAGEQWASHVEVDGKLVTGQNPASSKDSAEAVLKLLK